MTTSRTFYVPSVNLIGQGCLQEMGNFVQAAGYKKAFVVTDKVLVKTGIAQKVLDVLDGINVSYSLFDEVEPNPTSAIVHRGLEMLNKSASVVILSIGGGSPQDCAKAIGIIKTNGGISAIMKGCINQSTVRFRLSRLIRLLGTSSELTINYVITDEERQVKMVMVDKNSLVQLSVNDPALMVNKPKELTAATGMDALTHAIESIVTPGSYAVTETLALGAVELIFEYLPRAVKNGQDIEAREQMVHAIFLAGLAFNNAGLGFVHSMAHQLGGVYNMPHGVCNAMLLPIVERENAKYVPHKFRKIAKTIGADVKALSDEECAEYVIMQIERLSEEVDIPKTLSEIGLTDVDLDKLAENSLLDACAPGNPFMPTKEETIKMFEQIL
ncbi:iron-containing alcohol dehydrogenase [Bacillus sonorensis]|nr:iron-containing alcohol dehydrogenase [Bacillus sonorensis]